ncbi:MAG TPA: hypothetical protein VIM14_08385, partial [Polyangia bacterium]
MTEHCRLKRQQAVALVAFAAFTSSLCGGCLSNEYVIPKAELTRLVQLPPEQRGQRLQVVQELGDRRSEAIDTTQPPQPSSPPEYGQGQGYETPPEGYVEGESESHLGVGILIVPGQIGGPTARGGVRGPGPLAGPRGPTAALPSRAAPSRRPGVPASGIGNGSGGGGKDELVALLIVVAVLATFGMVATEGARYDGSVAMYPWQPVHLKDDQGREREVPLAALSLSDVESARKAVVMDDEGWGLMRLGRKPLDRRGFAFKLDLGAL